MPQSIKIATCCYCGAKSKLARAAKRLSALKCGNCGAPLTQLKFIRQDPAAAPPRDKRGARKRRRNRDDPRFRRPPRKTSRRGKRSGGWRAFARILEDWLDEIEDVFD